MKKILLLKGLPASGKSTWARNYCQQNPMYKRVNKDDLRAMISCRHTKGNEKFVLEVRDKFVVSALKMGYSVIVDDTNLHPKHLDAMMWIAYEYFDDEVAVEVMEFDTPIEECILRDAARPISAYVGEEVIRRIAKDREKWKQPTGVT